MGSKISAQEIAHQQSDSSTSDTTHRNNLDTKMATKTILKHTNGNWEIHTTDQENAPLQQERAWICEETRNLLDKAPRPKNRQE